MLDHEWEDYRKTEKFQRFLVWFDSLPTNAIMTAIFLICIFMLILASSYTLEKPAVVKAELSFISKPVERFTPVADRDKLGTVWSSVLEQIPDSLNAISNCLRASKTVADAETSCSAQIESYRSDLHKLIERARVNDAYGVIEYAAMNKSLGLAWGRR